MYVPSFNGCWAKIERAKEHAHALNLYMLNSFGSAEQQPRLGVKFEPDTGEYILYVNRVPYMDSFYERVSLGLGDVVHNLRASLDHLAYQLALRYTDDKIRKERRVQFPIDDSPEAFDRSRADRLKEVSEADCAIIERFQPYHPIDSEDSLPGSLEPLRPLALLRDLTDTDKHRLLAVVMIPPQNYATVGGPDGIAHRISWEHTRIRFAAGDLSYEIVPIEFGAVVARAPLPDQPPNIQMDMAGYILPEVVLPQGWPVSSVVDRMAALVVKILREFDPVL